MTVDGIHSTERSMVGTFTMLDSKVLYVGGHPRAMRMGQGIIVTNYFKGCMKKVFVFGSCRIGFVSGVIWMGKVSVKRVMEIDEFCG